MVYLLTHYKPATARNRYTGLQPFFRWLTGPLPQPLPPPSACRFMAPFPAQAAAAQRPTHLKHTPTHSSAQRHPHYQPSQGKPKQRQRRQPLPLLQGGDTARPRPLRPRLGSRVPRRSPHEILPCRLVHAQGLGSQLVRRGRVTVRADASGGRRASVSGSEFATRIVTSSRAICRMSTVDRSRSPRPTVCRRRDADGGRSRSWWSASGCRLRLRGRLLQIVEPHRP